LPGEVVTPGAASCCGGVTRARCSASFATRFPGPSRWISRARQTERSFRSYILGIAKHQLFDYLRAEHRAKRREADLETLVIDDVFASPEEWVSSKREKRLLLHGLRCLPLPLQLVLELRYWERLSDSEVAEVLELPLGTVKTRIARGREALRDEVMRLADSPEQLKSTLDSLEDWAARTHDAINP
jgi:RNA polymerase sigma factor (sigma-70 family)